MSSVAMWLESTDSPLGSRIDSGFVAISLWCTGASDIMKLLDAPESNIAHASLFFSVIVTFFRSADAASLNRPR